ncbi:MAG: penicillin-binding protein 1C [Bacteroidia bacterium]|nr:penicillin-binding protein 1C [Bacteroidia bacterium]
MLKSWRKLSDYLKKLSLKKKIAYSVALILLALYWAWLPSRLFDKPYSKVLQDENNNLLAAQIAPDGQWRFPQEDSVPYKFEKCVLTFEDEYFYKHPGINPVSIFKSFQRNAKAGRIKSGGSTITMQLARMMRNNQNRTYYHKVVELLLAFRIECSYRKKSILNTYCANAPFGSNVVGLSAAAWRYFGRSANKLSWAENAALAVLPNAPALIYPGKNHERLLQKRNRLLKKLAEKNIIDTRTYQLALLEPLPERAFTIPQLAPHLLNRCIKNYPETDKFLSTLNQNLQVRADEILNKHVNALIPNQIGNACAIIAETQSGKVLAYIGNSASVANEHQNFVDIIESSRSTGSILKPFLFGFMLNENKLLPTSLVEDVPTQIGSYGPRNFSLDYDGLVPANQAIARSLNVPAIKMLQEYGVGKFHQRLKQLGFSTFSKSTNHYGLSLILGGGEANLWELASAYASMGRALNGYSGTKKYTTNNYHSLYFLKNENKETTQKHQTSDLINASALYYTLSAMTELLRPQDYVGWSQFLSKNKISWKTGTSFGFRDAWAIGLNSKYTVAVWVGNAQGEGRPGLTGVSAAAPLMFALFNLLPPAGWFQKPLNDLEKVKVCKASGFRASDICPETFETQFQSGAGKTKICPFHKIIHLNETETQRVNSNCYPVHKMKTKAWFVLSPTQEFYYKQHNPYYKSLPEYLPECQTESQFHQMEIIYPRPEFKIYIPVDETGTRSKTIFKATHKNANATLFWYLDGEYLGTTQKFHEMAVQPAKGQHSLELTDNFGETVVCKFELIEK